MTEAFAQFASPAKRRKMASYEDDAEGGLCGLQAKGSRLKDTKTPVKQQQADYDMPNTPGSKLGAGMEDGLLSASPEQLPANLMLLHQLLGALYVTMPLVKSRSKATTYLNLRVPVQNFTGRDFQVTHIQQIKALCPEALGWEHILAVNPASKKQEQQLLLKLPVDAGKTKQSADTAQMQQLFFKRLQQHMMKHRAGPSGEVKVPLAELPPLAGPNARDCTPNRRPINMDSLPGTPQTAPTAGAAACTAKSSEQLLLSPPPKRAATSMKPASLAGLMSPPPARTRSSRSRQADHKDGDSSFSFSPMPRQPTSLFSPKAAAPGGLPLPAFGGLAGGSSSSAATRHHTPLRGAEGAGDSAGAETPGGMMRPSNLFGTPVATATPQQQASTGLLRRPADMHATPTQASEAAAATPEVPPPATGVKVRKLTFDSAVKAPAAARGGAGATAGGAGGVKPGGIKFELGGSALALLEKVTNSQVQQEQADRTKELEQQRALDMLPGSFDVLRAVFGDKGPCVKPKSEVLVLLRQKSTCKAGMSTTDAAEQLELLMRFVPDFVRTVNSPGQSLAGLTQSVRINRQIGWPAARQKLLAAAAQARATGIAAAASALAAEQQRERQEAADLAAAEAAAAAAAEQASDEMSEDADGADELSIVDQAGLDILAQLSGGSSSASGSSSAAKQASSKADGVSDEALMLLSGGAGSSKAAVADTGKKASNDMLLSCLAFKAPARKHM
uniref:CDT1 Geminin-binding domain-containing protein n=1 Tax=Tetradesmus obliquus TaxID=3088 RepID=A0A383W7V9_TETOB|eukprot:jgi/Sobl393_1/3198/SZX73718.1